MKKNYIEPNWPAPKNVQAFTSMRSYGEQAFFNLSSYVDDDPKNLIANRKLLQQQLELPSEPIWLQQVHGVRVICLDENPTDLKADAAYTKLPNLVCVAQTADCLPILLCNQAGTVVAAIHAGWRSLVGGVIENTLEAIKVPGEQLLVWLGPAIGSESFEVGEDVRAQFIQHDSAAASAFKELNHDKWLCNIYALAKMRLNHYNIANIFGGEFDTYTDDRFFSYRREAAKAGRMASLIWFEKV